jgi:uncharacterized membrane protein YfcA
MTLSQASVLFVSGVLAGGLNALAGGGGFITLPALIWSGATPILANTTGTIAVWPGLMAALVAFRKRLQTHKHPLLLYTGMGAVGSSLGAWLLLLTTNSQFMALLPWLLLFATVLFIFGRAITDRLVAARGGGEPFPRPVAWFLLFLIAIYGGYFGGGMGIMTLAVLTLIGMRDIHEMNALKSLLVTVINGVGVAIFVATGKVEWARGLVMVAGCIVGGYGAGNLSQKVDPVWLRRFISFIAIGMTIYFFYHQYIWSGHKGY